MRKIGIFYFIIVSQLIFIAPCMSKDLNTQVFRIKSSCGPNSEQYVQTGFRTKIKSTIGIVTALHGIVGCKNYSAANTTFGLFNDLSIIEVDIDNDTAFLYSLKIASLSSQPLEQASEISKEALKIYGYPRGLPEQMDHTLQLHEKPLVELHTLIPQNDLLPEFLKRKSPIITTMVISLSGSIQPGYSGAPILNSKNQVVGVANGGLVGGSADIGWAIPFGSLRLTASTPPPIKDRLDYIAKLDSSLLFANPLTTKPENPKFVRLMKGMDDTSDLSEFLLKQQGQKVFLQLKFLAKEKGGITEFPVSKTKEPHKLEMGGNDQLGKNFRFYLDKPSPECKAKTACERLIISVENRGKYFYGVSDDESPYLPVLKATFKVNYYNHVGQGYFEASLTPE